MKRHLLLLLFLALTGCSGKEVKTENQVKPPTVASMEVDTVSLTETFKVLGEIEALDSVPLFPKVKGKLIEYSVKKGDAVKKGDVIARFDRDEIGYRFQEVPLLSPIDGIVGDIPAARGEEVRPESVVARILHVDQVKAVMQVSEKQVGSVFLGQPATVAASAYPDHAFEGFVTEISPIIDPKTRTFSIEITLLNEAKKLFPGMFVKADLAIREIEMAILLPEEVVVSSERGSLVYIIEEGKALGKQVKTGLRVPGKVQIVSGLSAGERVIVSGQHKVYDGCEVSAP